MYIPLSQVKSLIDPMTIHSLIEISGYSEAGNHEIKLQVTGIHPEIGDLTILLTSCEAYSFQCADLIFEKDVMNWDTVEVFHGITAAQWEAQDPARQNLGRMLGRTAFLERLSASTAEFIRAKAVAAGIATLRVENDAFGRPTELSLEEAARCEKECLERMKLDGLLPPGPELEPEVLDQMLRDIDEIDSENCPNCNCRIRIHRSEAACLR